MEIDRKVCYRIQTEMEIDRKVCYRVETEMETRQEDRDGLECML